MKKKDEFVPIKAAGGIVWRIFNEKPQVLMIYRRDVWDLPKGKIDKGEKKKECAIREVSEETGSTPPIINKKIGTTTHRYTDEWGSFRKKTHWYAMQSTAKKFTPQASEDIEKVCWIDIGRAIEIAGYDNLKKILKLFKAWLENEPSLSKPVN